MGEGGFAAQGLYDSIIEPPVASKKKPCKLCFDTGVVFRSIGSGLLQAEVCPNVTSGRHA